MSKPDAPAPPDYKGAAEMQASSQRINQFTPYGSMQYSYKGDDNRNNPVYESRIQLDPRAQKVLDTQMDLSGQMGQLALGQLPQLQDQYSKPMDLSSVPQIADKAYSAMTSRLDPQWQQREGMEYQRLANQGLSPGGEAYDNAMRNFGNQRNDAYQQANLAAIQTMPQTYQLASAAYNQPLNTFNALRTGAQVQNPQFQGTGSGTNYLGAAQSLGQAGQQQYGTEVGQYNAMMNGLFGLGGAGIMAISDRRLKSNIKRVGTHELGIGIYEYDLFGERQTGVMADEVETVKPEAVVTLPSGIKAVNYGML